MQAFQEKSLETAWKDLLSTFEIKKLGISKQPKNANFSCNFETENGFD